MIERIKESAESRRPWIDAIPVEASLPDTDAEPLASVSAFTRDEAPFAENESRTPPWGSFEAPARPAKNAAGFHATLKTLAQSSVKDLQRFYDSQESLGRFTDPQRQKISSAYHQRTEQIANEGSAGPYAKKITATTPHVLRLSRETLGSHTMSDPAQLQARVAKIIEMARANAVSARAPDFSAATFKDVARRMLGLNEGRDEISETTVEQVGISVELNAFDRAGFHVFNASLSHHPSSLEIEELSAMHGRNVEDNGWYLERGEAHKPGRGNAGAVAQWLAATVDTSLAAGFSKLSLRAASEEVAVLYRKMGFVSDTTHALSMALNLSNSSAVEQMVLGFGAARAAVTDVPKNVSERELVRGNIISPPNRLRPSAINPSDGARKSQWSFDQPGFTGFRFILARPSVG